MNDFRPSARCASPVKVSWFEFLLNPSLLEQHLSQDNPDPSPFDLIVSFLSNCSSFSSEVCCNGNRCSTNSILAEDLDLEIDEDKTDEPESKKNQALKLLALKVGAHLRWDLNLLEKKLPITMLQMLLKELLKITGHELKPNGEVYCESLEPNPNSVFAFLLYYTWVLRSVVDGSYPSRTRTANIQIPGQVDLTIVPPSVIENILRKLQDEARIATEALEAWLQASAKVQMPTMSCFGAITDECSAPVHQWNQGAVLEQEEIVCQLSYTLGRFYFFQEKYDMASKHFTRSSELKQKLKNPLFCMVQEPKLKGFYNACADLLGFQKQDSSTPLKECLQQSVKSGHSDTVQILKTDNVKRELPLALRYSVEVSVQQEHSGNQDLLMNITFSNALRCVLDGGVIMSDWLSVFKSNEEKSSLMLCELIREVLSTCSLQQKLFLQNFIRTLCLASVPAKKLLKKFEVLDALLPEKDVEELFAAFQSSAKREHLQLEKTFMNDVSVQINLLERKLLSAYDTVSIRPLVTQLRGYGKCNIFNINKRWEKLRVGFIPADQEIMHIFMAKSKELRAMKNYGDSRHLVKSVESEMRNMSTWMARNLNWELLELDLLEILDAPVYVCQPSPYRAEVVQHILSSKRELSSLPDPKLTELCAAVLLNFREWDKIGDMAAGLGPHFQISHAISAVCRDVFLNKGSRNASKELWDLVLPIFTAASVNPLKRTSSGVIKDIPREYSHAIMDKFTLLSFINKLKDTSSLGIIISCLAKFYNILKDDSMGEIFLEYQGLWPSSVSNAAIFNMSAVSDAFQATLQHALTIHPTHSAWLRTKGDVMYVQGHYSCALKYYLSAAMVSTDYFNLPLPKILFDDLMFKHMIHCCTKIHNHTQAAVLHQFLEEANYPMAFKALGERVCNDSCDSYYPFIWDVTLLEYLINLHSRRGDLSYRQLVMHLIGQLELNANNNEEIQREAANLRKGRFLRAMTKQFL